MNGRGAVCLNSNISCFISAVGWTSGLSVSAKEWKALQDAETSRISALRANKRLPKVFFDITIKGFPIGRVVMVLYADVAPLAAENFRAFCTGEDENRHTIT